jgi:hypothetical protein
VHSDKETTARGVTGGGPDLRSSAITAFHRTISLLIYVLPPFLFNVSLASVDLGSNREMMPETQKEDETWRAKIPDSPD